MSRRVFVAGAAGVIGRRLTPLLVLRGYEVIGTTRSADKAPRIEALGAKAAVSTCSTRPRSRTLSLARGRKS